MSYPFVVMKPENTFVMRVVSRHKSYSAARRNGYEVRSGDSPSKGDRFSREDVAERFRIAWPKDGEDE